MNLSDQPLKGKIALVTGASRGGGKGIALVLGEAGATVYITGRSSGTSTRTDLPQTTLEATATEITARGGKGIPVVCDSANDADMAAVIAHIERDHNRLDILVNNAWAGYEGYDNTFNSPFWEQSLERWDKMLRVGLRSHLAMTHHAVRLMLPRRAGLIINTTTYIDPLNWASERFLQSVPYDTVKMAINRLSWGMANNLREYNIPVLALAPGWMRTESMDLTEEQKLKTESVEYTGRAVVALATDPQLMRKTGRLLQTADLAREYDFRDIDGRQVAPFYELFPEFVM